jgi:hypothetical protein
MGKEDKRIEIKRDSTRVRKSESERRKSRMERHKKREMILPKDSVKTKNNLEGQKNNE